MLSPHENIPVSSNQDHERTATLCFRASNRYRSEPIPIPFLTNMTMMKEFIDTFFSMDETVAALLAGTDSIVTKQSKDHIYPLQEKWVKECKKLGAKIPLFTEDDSSITDLFQVQTSGLKFPGLKVVSLISIGSTKQLSCQSGNFPVIQFVLIRTENKAEGLLKGIYNVLTGSSSTKKEKTNIEPIRNQESMEHSFTKVSIEPTDDGLNFVFTSDAMIEITVRFPSFLMKILPVSKEKAEEQGSLAVTRFIDKDVQRSLDRVAELYAKFVLSSNG